jgi:hypothetical protein
MEGESLKAQLNEYSENFVKQQNETLEKEVRVARSLIEIRDKSIYEWKTANLEPATRFRLFNCFTVLLHLGSKFSAFKRGKGEYRRSGMEEKRSHCLR